MNSIEKITESITADAKAYAEDVRKNAAEQSARLIAEANEKSAKARADILAKGKKECEAVQERAASSADVLERNILLDAKSALIDKVYEESLSRLLSLPEEKYYSLLCSLLSDAIDGIGEEEDDGYGYTSSGAFLYTVKLNKADKEKYGKKLLSSALTKAKEKKCSAVLSEENAEISGGMIVRRGDIEINASLEMLIKGAREKTEAEVCSVLFSL